MTKFLTELITDQTQILKLEFDPSISSEEKMKILDLDSSLSDSYIKNMYYQSGNWYYFKKDKINGGYPFYIVDELMGTYLAKLRNLPTVLYEIAQVGDLYGLASVNFKKEGFKYYTISELIDNVMALYGIDNIEMLKSFAVDLENEKKLIEHLFNLFALDIHMLQKDRGKVNLQFEVNKKTNFFDIAPLYDFSNCSSKVGLDGISIPNKIIKLTDLSIRSLLRKEPRFMEYLELCLETSMEEIWNQICLDYYFNQDSCAYSMINEYYKEKDKTQKLYIKEMIMDAKKL